MEPPQSTKRKRSLGLDAYDSDSGNDDSLAPNYKKKKISRLSPAHKAPWIAQPPPNGENRLSKLSDELLLRILKCLDVKQVLGCRFVSKKWRELASDGEVWRGLYWERFVKRDRADGSRPLLVLMKRKREIYKKKEKERDRERKEKWMLEMRMEGERRRDEEVDVGDGGKEDRTPWMARYKLSTNWSMGRARLSTIYLGALSTERPSNTTPPPPKPCKKALAQMHNGILYTADAKYGLRAWNLSSLGRLRCTSWDTYVASKAKHGDRPAQTRLHTVPTAMTLDTSLETPQLAIGFEDGSWGLWNIPLPHKGQPHFQKICSSNEQEISSEAPSPGSSIVEITSHNHYLLTITSSQLLRLHKLFPGSSGSALKASLVHELTSHTSWPPYALSIRSTPSAVVASIAYAIPTFRGDWSIGIQELHVDDTDGKIVESRIVNAVQGGFFLTSPNPAHPANLGLGAAPQIPSSNPRLRVRNALTLTYTHPYLVVGSGNNRLWRYLVHSSAEKLRIGERTEMFGCTSGVVGLDVGHRGRLVSVQRGGDVSVRWLEGMSDGISGKKEKTVDVKGGVEMEKMELEMEMEKIREEEDSERWEKEWVGSDEERIVVLRSGRVLIYDFRRD